MNLALDPCIYNPVKMRYIFRVIPIFWRDDFDGPCFLGSSFFLFLIIIVKILLDSRNRGFGIGQRSTRVRVCGDIVDGRLYWVKQSASLIRWNKKLRKEGEGIFKNSNSSNPFKLKLRDIFSKWNVYNLVCLKRILWFLNILVEMKRWCRKWRRFSEKHAFKLISKN